MSVCEAVAAVLAGLWRWHPHSCHSFARGTGVQMVPLEGIVKDDGLVALVQMMWGLKVDIGII